MFAHCQSLNVAMVIVLLKIHVVLVFLKAIKNFNQIDYSLLKIFSDIYEKQVMDVSISTNYNVKETGSAASKVDCARACSEASAWCRGLNFDTNSGTCRLLVVGAPPSPLAYSHVYLVSSTP